MNHCFMSCKHKTLESAAPLDSSVAVSHIQRLIPKGKWFSPYRMNHQSYSPVVKHFAWLWWSPTASEALSYRLNLCRSMPPDLPRTLSIIRSRKKFGALRAPHGRTNPTLYLCPGPPLLQPLGPPLLILHETSLYMDFSEWRNPPDMPCLFSNLAHKYFLLTVSKAFLHRKKKVCCLDKTGVPNKHRVCYFMSLTH